MKHQCFPDLDNQRYWGQIMDPALSPGQARGGQGAGGLAKESFIQLGEALTITEIWHWGLGRGVADGFYLGVYNTMGVGLYLFSQLIWSGLDAGAWMQRKAQHYNKLGSADLRCVQASVYKLHMKTHTRSR